MSTNSGPEIVGVRVADPGLEPQQSASDLHLVSQALETALSKHESDGPETIRDWVGNHLGRWVVGGALLVGTAIVVERAEHRLRHSH